MATDNALHRPAANPGVIGSGSFLRNYQPDARAAARNERVLAISRAFLTSLGLVIIYFDPTEPSRFAEVTYGILCAYALCSAIVLVLVRRGTKVEPWHTYLIHGLDILWVSALTFVSAGPMSPFFLFFVFVVLAAAFRWGFRETITTAGLTTSVFLTQAAFAASDLWSQIGLAHVDVELNRTLLRVLDLMLTGVLLGYLGEQEKQLRAELAVTADAARQPRVDLGLDGAVSAVARGLLRTFEAPSVAIVLQADETRYAHLWRVDRATDFGRLGAVSRRELDSKEQAAWLFPDGGGTWHAERSKDGKSFTVGTTEPGVWPLRPAEFDLSKGPAEVEVSTTVTCANIGLADQWQGRLYIFNMPHAKAPERYLHLLDALVEHITPGLSNVMLLRRLHSQAGAVERARVARELHDGTIQALCAIGMKIEALRRDQRVAANGTGRELDEIQRLLEAEVLTLRELLQALRPIELDSAEQLGDVLASVVERFRRDTGVSARFVSTGSTAALHSTAALEVVRIVQEALVNVRKHSRARNVLVRLSRSDGYYHLVIEDDGRGFDFAGRLEAADLDHRRLGPAIIKERARLVGAGLSIDSTPGLGARIEVTLRESTHG